MVDSDGLSDVQIPSSFEIFYREEYPAIVAIAYGLTGSRWVAEDLAQEAFLRVHADWPRVARKDSPTAWVRRVVINLAKSRFRRLRSEAAASLRLTGLTVTMAEPDSDADHYWAIVRKLPSRQAQVLVLRYIDDLTISEIASVLGIADGTVKALLHQGRQRLKRQLDAKGFINGH